jgi:hypothetical protein
MNDSAIAELISAMSKEDIAKLTRQLSKQKLTDPEKTTSGLIAPSQDPQNKHIMEEESDDDEESNDGDEGERADKLAKQIERSVHARQSKKKKNTWNTEDLDRLYEAAAPRKRVPLWPSGSNQRVETSFKRGAGKAHVKANLEFDVDTNGPEVCPCIRCRPEKTPKKPSSFNTLREKYNRR